LSSSSEVSIKTCAQLIAKAGCKHVQLSSTTRLKVLQLFNQIINWISRYYYFFVIIANITQYNKALKKILKIAKTVHICFF